MSAILAGLDNKDAWGRVEACHALHRRKQGAEVSIDALAWHLGEHRTDLGSFRLRPAMGEFAREGSRPRELAGEARRSKGKQRRPPEVDDAPHAGRLLLIRDLSELCADRPDRYLDAIEPLEEPGGVHATDDSDIRLGWALLLRSMGDEGRRAIVDAPKAPSPRVQATGLIAVWLLGDDTAKAHKPLQSLLGSPEPDIRFVPSTASPLQA